MILATHGSKKLSNRTSTKDRASYKRACDRGDRDFVLAHDSPSPACKTLAPLTKCRTQTHTTRYTQYKIVEGGA